MLIIDVLCHWIEIDSLTFVDSAITNKFYRHDLLELIGNDLFVLRRTFQKSTLHGPPNESRHFLKWIKIRHLKLDGLFLTACHFVPQMISINTTKIKTLVILGIYISELNEIKLSEIINACPNLRSIESVSVDGFSDQSLALIDPQILNKLEKINYYFDSLARDDCLTQKSFTHFSEYCSNLITINITFHTRYFKKMKVYLYHF